MIDLPSLPLPARAVSIALTPQDAPLVEVHALDQRESGTIDLMTIARGGPSWLEYVRGPAWALRESSRALTGWAGSLAGDVPLGAGLASSAAVELATLRAFAVAGSLVWSPTEMAQLGQRAENQWVGVNCGIMDQMISAAGEAGHALLIDCRTLALTPVPMPSEVVVVVMDTSTRRGLMDSAYDLRRRQCEDASQHFGVKALRDVYRSASGLDAALCVSTAQPAPHRCT